MRHFEDNLKAEELYNSIQNVKEVVYRFYDSAKISRPKQTNNTDGGDYRSQIQIHVIFLGLLLRHQTELLMESRLVVAKSR